MRKAMNLIIAVVAWFAVIMQLIIMLHNRVEGIGETLVRFFSFFTILTNTLVAAYFLYKVINPGIKKKSNSDHPGFLTALTVYITLVGLVYQLALRHIWSPTGMQMIVDELLHTIIPILVISYWIFVQEKSKLKWSDLPVHLVYPLVYLIYILTRGQFSGFYPYYFINPVTIGWTKVLLNTLAITAAILLLSAIFIGLGKFFNTRKQGNR